MLLSVDGGEPVGTVTRGERAGAPGGRSGTCAREPESATWGARPQILIGVDSLEDLAAASGLRTPVIPDSLGSC